MEETSRQLVPPKDCNDQCRGYIGRCKIFPKPLHYSFIHSSGFKYLDKGSGITDYAQGLGFRG